MYRNAYWSNRDKCIKLRTWDKEGTRVTVDVPFQPYLYVESPRGQYLSIFGHKLEKREFKTPWDRIQFTKNYGSDHYYENFEPSQQFLLDCFWKNNDTPDFAKYDLRILFYDIEVDVIPGTPFVSPEVASSEINIITAYDTIDKKYHVFSKNPYNGNNLGNDVIFKNSGSEKQLLLDFISFWMSNDYPDIVTGWNSDRYDLPYIKNRIIRVLGESFWLMLSPFNIITEEIKKDKAQREVLKYNIAGVDNLDNIEVYAKIKVVKQESYKLDFIAEQEIGAKKLDYSGMSIGEFMIKEWDRFVEYNVKDVELMVKMEEKLQYFTILRTISNIGCCNTSRAILTIPTTNGGVCVLAKKRGRILHTYVRHYDENADKPGGFVHSVAGIHNDIVTLDATSLYPSLIRTFNISPETKLGMTYFRKDAKPSDLHSFENEVKFIAKTGKNYHLTEADFKKFIKAKNLTIAFNGCVFDQRQEGILPEYMRHVFERRVECRARMKVLNSNNKVLEEELKDGVSTERKSEIDKIFDRNNYEIAQMDIMQYAYKILINSGYGAISSRYNPIGDDDLANAITVSGSSSIKQINIISDIYIKDKRREMILAKIDEIEKELMSA